MSEIPTPKQLLLDIKNNCFKNKFKMIDFLSFCFMAFVLIILMGFGKEGLLGYFKTLYMAWFKLYNLYKMAE